MTQRTEAEVVVRNLHDGERVNLSEGVYTANTGDVIMTVTVANSGGAHSTYIMSHDEALALGKKVLTAGRMGRYEAWKAKRRFEKDMRQAMRQAMVK